MNPNKTSGSSEEPDSLGSSARSATLSRDPYAQLQNLRAMLPGKGNVKDPKDYKFWNTQPVPRLNEYREPKASDSTTDGPIMSVAACGKLAQADQETLIDGFEWCEVDITRASILQELHDLLYYHYVEDDEGSFRLNYRTRFLSWALQPPGWKKYWHIGVRTKGTENRPGRLVAFVAGVPITLDVRNNVIKAAEINFLTIHRKLRGKRLAPVLIKEITRRCYREGIYQALYTAGTVLPSPVGTCRYYHRSLDWEHLHNTGFAHLPRNSTAMRQTLRYKIERRTSTKGLRLMEAKDVPRVKELLNRFLSRFDLSRVFTEDEVAHYFCSDSSRDLVWSYVVETGDRITDFASFYLLESTVLQQASPKKSIRAAYLFYYACEVALEADRDSDTDPVAHRWAHYQQRLQHLMHDMLILAKQMDFHVFNALTVMDNSFFLQQQKFEPGDPPLHFYVFNWRTAIVPNGMDDQMRADASNAGGIGAVML